MRYDCLIIDDERLLADSTAEYFNLFGVRTAAVYSAEEGRNFFRTDSAKLLLLDINLEDGSGFALCRELRESMGYPGISRNIPILFISARTSDDDQIMALNIGGDDYVQKPYSLGVLLAKVRAVLKRYGQREEKNGYADGHLRIDIPARSVSVDGSPARLTAREFKLLSCLVENRDRVVPKQELFEKVWGDKYTGDGTLNVHIRKIREIIERNPNRPEYIVTFWGEGYKFEGSFEG